MNIGSTTHLGVEFATFMGEAAQLGESAVEARLAQPAEDA